MVYTSAERWMLKQETLAGRRAINLKTKEVDPVP
jgi:hypothetical protein